MRGAVILPEQHPQTMALRRVLAGGAGAATAIERHQRPVQRAAALGAEEARLRRQHGKTSRGADA